MLNFNTILWKELNKLFLNTGTTATLIIITLGCFFFTYTSQASVESERWKEDLQEQNQRFEQNIQLTEEDRDIQYLQGLIQHNEYLLENGINPNKPDLGSFLVNHSVLFVAVLFFFIVNVISVFSNELQNKTVVKVYTFPIAIWKINAAKILAVFMTTLCLSIYIYVLLFLSGITFVSSNITYAQISDEIVSSNIIINLALLILGFFTDLFLTGSVLLLTFSITKKFFSSLLTSIAVIFLLPNLLTMVLPTTVANNINYFIIYQIGNYERNFIYPPFEFGYMELFIALIQGVILYLISFKRLNKIIEF